MGGPAPSSSLRACATGVPFVAVKAKLYLQLVEMVCDELEEGYPDGGCAV